MITVLLSVFYGGVVGGIVGFIAYSVHEYWEQLVELDNEL